MKWLSLTRLSSTAIRAFIGLSAVLTACTMPNPAFADDADRTVTSEIDPTFVEGRFAGCDIVFSVMHSDGPNFDGGMVLFLGSLHVGRTDKNLIDLGLKIAVGRTQKDSAGKPALTLQAPTSVVLIDGLGTNIDDLWNASPAETLGYRIFVFGYGKATKSALLSAANSGKLHFTYVLDKGPLGSNVDLDLTMQSLDADSPAKSKLNPGAGRQLGECINKILQ